MDTKFTKGDKVMLEDSTCTGTFIEYSRWGDKIIWVGENGANYETPKEKILPATPPPPHQVQGKEVQTAEEINFGDYVTIEMNRYGAPNEFYTHKVVTRSRSNAWVDVPVVANATEVLHDEMADVVWCICEGICEDTVLKYRLSDVKKQQNSFKTPPQEGQVKNRSQEGEQC